MATGDETQAGPRPSLPPRRPAALGGDEPTIPPNRVGGPGPAPGGGYDDGYENPLGRFGTPGPGPDVPSRGGAGRPQILAPQANEWAESGQEVEVVRGRRTGLILLFLLALLAVAVIALGLAILSVFRDGEADPAAGPGVAAGGTETTTSLEPNATTTPTTIDPNALQVVITEEPFVCDGGVRPFAMLSGATPNEEIAFTSPQSPNLKAGVADANGELPIRWSCTPDQAGTTWELTATGAISGKTATFIFAGATEPAGDGTGTTGTTTAPTTPTELTVEVIENPFACDGASRVFAGLSGAEPNEEIAFSSPQSPNLSSGTADANGDLPVRWSCTADQVGTMWELTATGVTSGRTVTFTFTGS